MQKKRFVFSVVSAKNRSCGKIFSFENFATEVVAKFFLESKLQQKL
jgi:hypothetical protein